MNVFVSASPRLKTSLKIHSASRIFHSQKKTITAVQATITITKACMMSVNISAHNHSHEPTPLTPIGFANKQTTII